MDPIGRELNSEERSVLNVLTQDGRSSHDRIATSLERDVLDVSAVLERLEHDGLVQRESGPTGEEGWAAKARPTA